jgi:hypothetical protein
MGPAMISIPVAAPEVRPQMRCHCSAALAADMDVHLPIQASNRLLKFDALVET